MTAKENIRNCNVLQSKYQEKIKFAEEDKASHGSYTREGLKALAEASMLQLDLKQQTSGEASKAHLAEATRLIRLVHGEMQHLGLIKKPVPLTEPVTQAAPVAQTSAKPAPAKGSQEHGELPSDFTPENYIMAPTELTLDNVKSNPTLVNEISCAIMGSNFQQLFPSATAEWDELPRTNFLFYGPPGTGKSFLCRAIAGSMAKAYPEGNTAFFLISSSDIASKYVGVTGHKLKAVFDAADKYDLAIVCVDEIEHLCPNRDSSDGKLSYTQNFLELIEGVHGRTSAMVIACTNVPWKVDPALLSRLSRRLFIDYPSEEDIADFWKGSAGRRDYFGQGQAQDELIALAASLCAQKHYSYRNLNTLSIMLRHKVEAKTLEVYPNGNPELEHPIPVTEEELRGIIDQLCSDYSPEEYQRYLKYNEQP